MDMDDLKTHIDSRMDKLEDKLDNHLERIANAETSIKWLERFAALIATASVSTIGYLIKLYLGVPQ